MEVTNLANAQNVGIIISPNLQKLKVWRKKGTKGYFMVFHTYKYLELRYQKNFNL